MMTHTADSASPSGNRHPGKLHDGKLHDGKLHDGTAHCPVVRRASRHGGGSAVEAELAQLLGIALPVLGDGDVQVEVDPRAEQLLDLQPGPAADIG